MADRTRVIDTALAFVPTDKRPLARPLVESLIDVAVTAIGDQYDWRYLETKKDDYTITSVMATYPLPGGCRSIVRMGKLANGVITRRFRYKSEEDFTDDYSYFSATTTADPESQPVYYIPISYDAAAGVQSFRIWPTPTVSTTVRVVYVRFPSKNDLAFIGNELLVVNRILMQLPAEYMPDAARFAAIFNEDVGKAIHREEKSRERQRSWTINQRAGVFNAQMAALND